jgi:hypothetical protein
MKALNKIRNIAEKLGYDFVNVDELKQDFEKRIFVYKVAILVFIVGMG